MPVCRVYHEDLDPYSEYKAVKLIAQTSLRTKAVVERRTGDLNKEGRRSIMTVVPTKSGGMPTGVKDVVDCMLDLKHPNIAKVIEAYDWNGYLHIITEDWSSENDRMYGFQSLTEGMVADVILGLTSAVRYMHEKGFVHGNLGFDDLLIRRTDDGEARDAKLDIKIIDFCLDRHVSPDKYIAQIQDRKYGNPPEAKDGVFTGQGDMWTIGSICFKLLTGDVSQENLKDRRDFDNSPLKRCSKEAQDFVKSLLRTEPARRLTPDEALEHPWFKSKISSRNVELSNDVLESLAKEESEGEFKRIACSIIANFASPDEIAEVRKLFEGLDTDHSGYLTYEQFTIGLKEKFSEDKLDKIFLTMDIDESGKIGYDEFLGATMNLKRDIEESKLIEAFHLMDVDGDGTIEVQDLVNLLSIAEEKARDLMREVCPSENPRMTQKQFIGVFRKKWSSWF